MSKFKRGIILFCCAIGIAFIVGQYPKLDFNNTFFHNSIAISREPSTNIKEKALFAKDITPVSEKFNGAESNTKTEIAITTSGQKLTAEEFPLGWYDRATNSQTPAKVAQEGMNLLVVYTNRHDEATIANYLDAAQAAGMKVILEPYRKIVKAGDIKGLIQFVRKFKEHPAVFGWYLSEEPERKGILPQILESSYQAIKAESPDKPIFVLFHPQLWSPPPIPFKSYWKAFDIFMGEWYPSHYQETEFSNKFDVYAASLRKAPSFAGVRPFMAVLQAFGRDNSKINSNSKWRYPTVREQRYTIYTALLTGAKGLLFYAHHRTSQSWIDKVLKPLIQELEAYLPAIINGAKVEKVTVNRSDVQVALYQDPQTQQYLLIALHHGKGKINASIKLEKTIAANSVKLLGEERTVSLTNRILNDTFDSYGVNLYSLN
jgi:hypothetical protein